VQTHRRQNAGRAEIVLKLTPYQSRHDSKGRRRHELARNITELGAPVIRRTPEVACATLAVILPRVLVTRSLGGASQVAGSRVAAIRI